jgi:hypothetical protein
VALARLTSLVAIALLAALVAPAWAQSVDADARREAMRDYRAKRYADCGRRFDTLATAPVRRDSDLYNAACCYARAGDREAALARLDRARLEGHLELGALERDPDLASLRKHPRWSALVAAIRLDHERRRKTTNAEVARLFDEDQADRAGRIDWTVVGPRDWVRRKRLRQLMVARALVVADDHYHAAVVFQHGDTPTDYLLARTLARKAVALSPGHARARRLAAAAHDRYLWSVGKPQVYGTQSHVVNGVWTLEPIDRRAVSDAERERAGLATLGEAEDGVRALNVPESGQGTERRGEPR